MFVRKNSDPSFKIKKTVKYILIFCGIIIGLWIFGRLTNMLQFFKASSISDYPTIKKGDYFFGSNLIKPKRFSFICFYSTTPELGKQIWIQRVCGLEGDTIEIRNGELIVNNHYVDSNLTLSHNYILTLSQYQDVKDIDNIDDASVQFFADSVISYVSDETILNNSINAKRQILPKDFKDEEIRKQYSKPWNQDNFGPIVVPKGKYFLLGDNRMQSDDSRYIGFVNKSNYIATVIGR